MHPRPFRRLNPMFIGPLSALIFSAAVISFTTDRFLDTRNLLNVSLQVSIIAIMAIGSTVVILTGGIDLSPGSMVALLTMLMAIFMKWHQLPLGPAALLVLLLGCGLGVINGLMVAYLRIPSFIATLATLTAYKGWSFLYNNGSPIFSVSPALEPVFYGSLLGIPLPFYYVLICYAVAYVFLHYTVPGREIYAVGGNEAAARLSGIKVRRIHMLAYVIAGGTAGLASVVMAARLNSGSPNYGAGMELQAIGAAVIGGASLIGGVGNVLATLIGALTIAVVQNGLNLNDVATSWQGITLGIIIAAAVGIDRWRGEVGRLARRLAGAGARRASTTAPGPAPSGEGTREDTGRAPAGSSAPEEHQEH
jgi:ribose transport system permease protein